MRLAGGDGWASWFVLIMPFMEQENISRTWDFKTFYRNQPDVARTMHVKSYYCPARRSPGAASSI